MPKHSDGTINVFDAADLLAEAEIDILTVMLVLGIESARLDSITIDEIIDTIRNTYNYRAAEDPSGMKYTTVAPTRTASSKFLNTECNALTRRARRAWFNMEFAKEVMGQ